MHNGKSHKHEKAHEFIPKAVDQFIDQVAGKGKAANEALSEKMAVLKKKVSEWGWDEVADDVQTYVKRNPWKGLGAALGMGFLLGLLFAPTKKKD